ncbi:microcystin-dependent protein [Pedobacter psychrotolerans]|uniref:Microcystin-dependent protein n=1 Tax=Pedobacter psychrotolerans TaxID=1843235 RepID=A0A4R2H649_9SPHI|nr:tail fiber protein [Pedobacter psychrotolerans]TCO21438.1 microcystin-dependent protein [Pedobacter psychrotolerans]GGE38649.1 tail Collar domain-containing protein [Pedobacter psychrotolerans]
MDPLIGQIMMFAGTYAPRGWAFCQGQTMQIQQYQALFAVLGVTYGGDGRTTFLLPNLTGLVPVHAGTAASGTVYPLGRTGGSENVVLTTLQMPAHTHTVAVNKSPDAANSVNPENNFMADTTDSALGSGPNIYTSTAPNAVMGPTALSAAGGSQPHSNMQPYIAMNYIIALEGIYPSRN